jgi:geranylgeranyl diphosphate synthase type II
LILDYPFRPAKALRPAVCIATTRALGGSEQGVLTTAAVIELLHNAFLIHDDVEDESEYRRGELTLQRAHGLSVAVNVADGMFALALSALLENTELLDLRSALAILDVVAATLRDTFAGQALELSWIRDSVVSFDGGDYRAAYERLVLLKTSTYSFLMPVRVGCICAGAPNEIAVALGEFATHLGVAFQITDDLLNLREDATGYGKELNGDLREGKRTLMLLHALHVASAPERAHAARILGRLRARSGSLDPLAKVVNQLRQGGHLDAYAERQLLGAMGSQVEYARSEDDVGALRQLIERHDGLGYARAVASEHAAAARLALERGASGLVPGRARSFLAELPRYVVARLN